MKLPSAIIVSGGAESVSLGIAEVLWRAGVAYAAISLVEGSLLEGLPGCVDFSSVKIETQRTPAEAAAAMFNELLRLKNLVGNVVPVFPTEDDGLHLLNLLKDRLDEVAVFSRMHALKMGGLDKSELFLAIESCGLSDLAARTIVLNSPTDIDHAFRVLGDDIVVKPCFKPWRESVGEAGLKVLTSKSGGKLVPDFPYRLAKAWHLADTWVAQERLYPIDGGERSVCIVRSNVIHGCEVLERRKYPAPGGSAVWVRSQAKTGLSTRAYTIAEALDLRGLCELSFLNDRHGQPRLLELNTRPWLQMDLVEKSGFPIVLNGIRALLAQDLDGADGIVKQRDWLQPERVVLAWIAGDCGSRWTFLKQICAVIASKPIYAVYSNEIPGVRGRWIRKVLKKAWGGLFRTSREA